MNVYRKLQEILDAHPSGAPQSDYLDQILSLLFTEEEARLAAHMSYKPLSPETIATGASLPVETVEALLEGMADKVIIFSRKKDGKLSYGLLPTIPGLFEFPFMKGGGSPLHEKLGVLWEKYHAESLGNAFSGNPTPMMRVVPVGKSLDSNQTVHPYEEVAHLIDSAATLAVAQCACRVSVGKCDKPRDVCLIFDGPSRFLVEKGYARPITKKEGMDVLNRSEAAGLVHTSNNTSDKASVICNCCSCCCTILRGKTQLNNPHAFAPSRYLAEVNGSDCVGCGVCADERCPVQAIEVTDDIARVDPSACIGCGLCVTGCSADAVHLIKNESPPAVFDNFNELGLQILQEKGKLDKYVAVMTK